MSWNNKKSFKIKHENNVVENLRKVGKGRDRNPSKWFPEEQTFEAVLTKFRINLMTYFKFQKIMYSDIFFYLTIETAPVPRYFLPSSKIHIVFWHWPAEPRAIIIVIAPPVGHTFRFHPNLHNPLTTLQLVKGEPESNKRLWRRRPLPINNRPLSLLFFFSLLLLFCWCMIWGVQNLCTPYGIRWIIWWQQQEHQSVILLMWYVSHSRRVVHSRANRWMCIVQLESVFGTTYKHGGEVAGLDWQICVMTECRAFWGFLFYFIWMNYFHRGLFLGSDWW